MSENYLAAQVRRAHAANTDWRIRFLPSSGALFLLLGLLLVLTSIAEVGDTYRVVSDIYVHDLFSSGLRFSALHNASSSGTGADFSLECASVFGCATTLCRAVQEFGPHMNLTFQPPGDIHLATNAAPGHGAGGVATGGGIGSVFGGGNRNGICTSHDSRVKIDRLFKTSLSICATIGVIGLAIITFAFLFWATPALVQPSRISKRRVRIYCVLIGMVGFTGILLQQVIFLYQWRLRQRANLSNTTPPSSGGGGALSWAAVNAARRHAPSAYTPHTIDDEWDIPLYWLYGNINLIITNVVRTFIMLVFQIMTLMHYRHSHLSSVEQLRQEDAGRWEYRYDRSSLGPDGLLTHEDNDNDDVSRPPSPRPPYVMYEEYEHVRKTLPAPSAMNTPRSARGPPPPRRFGSAFVSETSEDDGISASASETETVHFSSPSSRPSIADCFVRPRTPSPMHRQQLANDDDDDNPFPEAHAPLLRDASALSV